MSLHKIEILRRQLGLEISDVARLSDVARGTIRSIEQGDRTYKVNRETAAGIAHALGTTLYDLFEETELSDLGRPGARGGTTFVLSSRRSADVVCGSCHLAIPTAHGTCLECVA